MNNINFLGGNAATKASAPNSVSKTENNSANTDKKSNGTSTKVIVGTGLAGLAAIGIYIATRGKGGAKGVTVPISELSNISLTPNEMSVDAFKAAGNKFVKGKAITQSGENYTGLIIQQKENGEKYVRNYTEGKLENVKKYMGDNVISQKHYSYNEQGVLENVIETVDGKTNNLYRRTVNNFNIENIEFPKGEFSRDLSTGNLIRTKIKGKGEKIFVYSQDGKNTLNAIRHNYTDYDTGKFCHDITLLHPDSKTPRITIKGDGTCRFYDKKGLMTDAVELDINSLSSIKYKQLQYSKHETLNEASRNYYLMDGDNDFQIFKITRILPDGTRKVMKQLHFDNAETGKGYIITKTKDGMNMCTMRGNKSVPQGSEEYNEVMSQIQPRMKKLISLYKQGLRYQNDIVSEMAPLS
ncbi:MAG: hypothetical protein NC200_04775 [Candidatus Gastranaerophilales bacterium]|nr:hypothetical protein [Candidatus Gastranaerophilales bacterium]